MAYEAKFLSDEEFDALPYPDVETSLGIADPKTQTAYVRRTQFPVMDAFTLAHELEHLTEDGEGKYSDHFANGVYYKNMGWVAPVLGGLAAVFAPAILPGLLGGGAAAGGAGSALGSFGVAPLSGSLAATGGLSPSILGTIGSGFGASATGAGLASSFGTGLGSVATGAGGGMGGGGILDAAGKIMSGSQTGSQMGGYLSKPSISIPKLAEGYQSGRPDQAPAPSILQGSLGFGAGAGGPGATGLGPDLFKNVRERMSGTQAGRNTTADVYGTPMEQYGFGLGQGKAFNELVE